MALEMMVSPFLGVVFDKLSSLIASESRLYLGIKKDLKKLSSTLSALQSVLVDADAKQINDQRVRDWLSELKDAAYDAEDVLDECEYEGLQQESDFGDTNCIEQVSCSLSTCFNFKQNVFRHKMGKKIRELIEKFDKIDAERDKFQLIPGVVVTRVDGFGLGQETGHLLTEPIIYGRGEEKESTIQILLNNSNSPNILSICPILGIGGLGKTTLAQLAYGDERVVNHFDTRIWICVSNDFNVKKITKMIIDHLLSERKCDLVDLSPMQNLLRTLLREKKILLVLDDVWDDRQENWNAIISCLVACGAKGSSIIVTTRLQTVVGSIIDLPTSCIINPTCDLRCLLEHDSWSLFEHCALGVVDRGNENLIAIGKVVVAKCKGVPLAIKAVGSLLNSKSEEFWKAVSDNEIWRLEEHGEDSTILPALRLSYYHLPPLYRRCFAYCSIYPKDWLFAKEKLIHGWMVNGYIHSRSGMEVEDVGDEIFNGLLQRSFFQDKHEDKFTKAVSCKMHDHVHDLACSVAENECWRMKTSKMGDVSQRIRHVSVTCNSPYLPNILTPLAKSQPYIRTLMFLVDWRTNLSGLDLFVSRPGIKHLRMLDLGGLWNLKSIPPWISHLRRLEYLNLGSTDIAELPEFVCVLTNLRVLLLGRNRRLTELPSSMGKLKNLRYLDLSYTSIKILPESICTLTNLQTLNLWFCPKLEMLPRDVKNIKNLRNLNIQWEPNTKLLISRMPAGIGQLTRLETLQLFVVNNASEGVAGIQELGSLNQLKGILLIQDIRNLRDPRNAQEANMMNKDKLSSLMLGWGSSEDGVIDVDAKEEEKKRSSRVLESLQPHLNLQMLGIREYPGVELPGWVGNCVLALPNLQKLDLSYMPNAAHDLRQLPPNLVTLGIVGCPKLRLRPELRYPSSIKNLAVGASNDPTLRSVEALPHLSTLQIEGYRCNQQETVSTGPARHLWITICCSKVENLISELENLISELENLAIGARFLTFVLTFFFFIISNFLFGFSCVIFSFFFFIFLFILRYRGNQTVVGARIRNLTCLRVLLISNCSSVKTILPEFQNLAKTLTILQLTCCHDFDYITKEGWLNLASLQTLKFCGCFGLTSLSDSPLLLRHLIFLTRLDLVNCPKLDLSAIEFQHLVSLRTLILQELHQLTSVPDGIQLLTTLQTLHILDCKNLKMLPQWLEQKLPRSLSYLEIRTCHSELHRRCETDIGEDWHKISHLQVDNME